MIFTLGIKVVKNTYKERRIEIYSPKITHHLLFIPSGFQTLLPSHYPTLINLSFLATQQLKYYLQTPTTSLTYQRLCTLDALLNKAHEQCACNHTADRKQLLGVHHRGPLTIECAFRRVLSAQPSRTLWQNRLESSVLLQGYHITHDKQQ